jgi:cytochrome c biogenesis protein CcmG/thiol:disulfide interchange protein DsbE
MRLAIAIVLVCGLAASASAQPAGALGKPLPSADLPVGTISVRVIDGAISAPLAGITVWLKVDGAPRTAQTDAAGRAVFAGVRVGAEVTAAISSPASVFSDAFVVPDHGGTRILMSTKPLSAGPSPRTFSGQARPLEGSAMGSLEVRLTYDDLGDPHPPAKVPVTLVGYHAAATVTVATASTDARGVAHFTGLDHTGSVAYFALATLSRNGAVDRLHSQPIVFDDTVGGEVTLAADRRTSKAPPIDELAAEAKAPPVARGKVLVSIEGVGEPGTAIAIIDAATGKSVASGTVADHTLALDVASHAGQVLYADAVSRGEHYRSRPFQPVADRGAPTAVMVYPRLMLQFSMIAEPVGNSVDTWGQFSVRNNSWIPFAAPPAIALPRGARKIVVAEPDRAVGTVTAAGLQLARAVPPGEQRLRARFEVPAGTDGKVHWSLDLPMGSYQSGFRIAKEPGVALIAPQQPVETLASEGESFLVIANITIVPKHTMEMTIELPKQTPAQVAVAVACQPLDPDRKTTLRGKPMPDFTAQGLDGKPFRASSLRGKLALVNFMATWDMLSPTERPTFAPLVAALGQELAVVLVASDTDPKVVAAKLGSNPAVRVVVDPPAKAATDHIGAIASAWGVHLLPESFLVDKHGIVRLYFANSRDWSTPDALACLRAVARD